MDGIKFRDVKLKKCYQAKTLAQVTNIVTESEKKHLNIDPSILFNRLLVITQRSSDMELYFKYELAAQPTSIFKDNYMRKTD